MLSRQESGVESVYLEVDTLDLSPFSESFSELFNDGGLSSILAAAPTQNGSTRPTSWTEHDDASFDVETRDIADLAPGLKDNDIDEIMVISPKLRQKRSSSVKESSLVDGVNRSSFKFLHVLPGHHANPIHLCRKRDTFKLYAMTIVRKDRTTSSAHVRHIETEREISQFILSLCNPFLAPYLWIFQDETAFYSVSDFYGGGNLREHIEQEGPISLDRAYFFACEILVGLNALHEEGIVHRDLRPENIMINVSGHIAIAGFQYSGNAQSPASLQQLGNNEYQPPEVLLGWAHDVKVDSWSFGTILHMMLFSSHPFVTTDDRDNAAVLQAKVIHCPVSFPNSRTVSWAAQDLIAHCLQRNSALRYDVRAIKAHVYFCSVDWSSILERNTRAPPSNASSSDLSCIRDDFPKPPNNLTERSLSEGFLSPDGQTVMQTPEVLDSFTPIPQRIFKPRVSEPIDQQGILSPRCPKRVSSQSCDRPVTRLEMVLEASDEDFSAGLEHASRESQDHSESDRQQDEAEANVISRNPMSLWESLDMELGSASSIHSQGTPDRQESPFLLLRKLRKSKSALSRHHGLSTLTVSSTTPSAQASNKLRKKMRSASSPMLRVPGSQISNDLPNGVQQIGGGIGYSPIIAPPARPRSIYRTALRSCQSLFFTGLPTLRHKLSMRSMRVSPESSEPETPAEIEHNHNTMTIMQGIYGNSWTIGMPATIPVALDNVTSPSNDSEGPLTPDSIPFKPPVGITMDDGGSTDLQLVSSSGLRLHM